MTRLSEDSESAGDGADAGRADSSAHGRRPFFYVAAALWLLLVVGWLWYFADMRNSAENDSTCGVFEAGESSPYLGPNGDAQWQPFPPGVICSYTVMMDGRGVEIVEFRPVPLAFPFALLLWGVTLVATPNRVARS